MFSVGILLTFLYWLLFNFLIKRYIFFQIAGFKWWVTTLLFNIKFVAGIAIWLVYTFYYTHTARNDVHKFYDNAVALKHIATENPKAFADLFLTGVTHEQINTSGLKNWHRNFDESPFNANRFVIRVNTILLFLSFNTYLVHVLFFCFLSLLGIVLMTNAIFKRVNQADLILSLPVLFLPSVLFWNSGVTKEPLLILGLGLLTSGILNFSSPLWVKSTLAIICGAVVVLLTKFFVLVCVLPAAISYLIFKGRYKARFILLKYAVVYLLCLLAAFNIHRINPKLNLPQMLANKYAHAAKEAAYFNAGSIIEIPEVFPSITSILEASATGVWNMLMRPYPFEADTMLKVLSTIENFVYLSFIIWLLTYVKWRCMPHLNLVMFCALTSLSFMALIGMCTPVVGNMMRYKAPILPLLFFAGCVAVNQKYIATNFFFLFRKNR